MKAQINTINSDAVVVSLYNDIRVVNQKWFSTEKKAKNFCVKYNYKVEKMSSCICNYLQYEQ